MSTKVLSLVPNMEKIITAVNKKIFAIPADMLAEWQMILSVFALRSALYFQEGKNT